MYNIRETENLIPMKKYCIIVLLIILSFLSNQGLIFVPFFYGIYIMMLKSKDNAFNLLFFFLPFSTIFKFNPSGISLFTVWEAFFIVKTFVSGRGKLNFESKVIVSMLLYFFYLWVVSLNVGTNSIISVVGLMLPTIVLVLGTYKNSGENFDRNAYSFSIGTALSNLCGLLANIAIPRMKQFATFVLNQKTIEEIDAGLLGVKRFYGLFGDPNILAIYTICSICIVLYLYLKGKLSILRTSVIMGILIITGCLTVSKTFVLLLILTIGCFLLSTLFNKKKKQFYKILKYAIIFIIIIYIVSFIFDFNIIIERYTFRLSETSSTVDGVNMSKLTTGRTDIWVRYFTSLNESTKLLTGYGINGGLTRIVASHNTFIEMLYIHGIIGMILYCIFLYSWKSSICTCKAYKRMKYSSYSWIFTIILIINLCSIDTYTWDFYYYMVAIAITFNKGDTNELTIDNL